MLRRTTTLALIAMAIGAASAATASANWTHNHAVLQSNVQVQFTGQTAFTSAVVGGVECQRDARAEFTANTTTGRITQFEIDLTSAGSTATQKCVTSGPLAPCKMKSAQSTGLPWTVHSDGADTVTITTGAIHYVLESAQGAACGVVQAVTLEPGTATAQITPGETCTVAQLDLSGQFSLSTGAKIQLHGKSALTPASTYGTSTSCK